MTVPLYEQRYDGRQLLARGDAASEMPAPGQRNIRVPATRTFAFRDGKIVSLHVVRLARMSHAHNKMPFHVRPMIAALAIRSSMSASECLPDIACGFNSGKSENRSNIATFTLDRLTWPMVQRA
jgi:hypothetical protein